MNSLAFFADDLFAGIANALAFVRFRLLQSPNFSGHLADLLGKELWQVERGGKPTLNGAPIQVSKRDQLSDACKKALDAVK